MSEWTRERNPVVAGSKIVEEKRCPTCGETKPAFMFFRNRRSADGLGGYCKPCWVAYMKEHEDPDKRAAQQRKASLRRNYGVTPDQYEVMLSAQNGVCATCGNACATGKRLAVDHCHRSGKVRGLLCRRCNSILGYADDDLELLGRLADYVTASLTQT